MAFMSFDRIYVFLIIKIQITLFHITFNGGWVKIGGYRLSEIAIKISDAEMDISENNVIKISDMSKNGPPFPICPKMDI
jgi:hypothetical protein